MLYQYAIVLNPKKKRENEPVEAQKILCEPRTVLARDEKTAAILAARAIPEEYVTRLDEVDVIVRPF